VSQELDIFEDLDKALSRLGELPSDDFIFEPQCELAVQQAAHVEKLQAFTPTSGLRPRRFGNYLLFEKLGSGGMGAVYRARHIHLQKSVAVKILPSDRAHNLRANSQFWREMSSLGQLSHPHLVAATDAGLVDDIPYLVMELVDGVNLDQFVQYHGTLEFADASEMIRQTAETLQYLHEHDMLHRDVKPSNLMLTVDGTIKVLDLGLVKSLNPLYSVKKADPRLSRAGTLAYMAPELPDKQFEADLRSDLFSLGCTYHYLLTGNRFRVTTTVTTAVHHEKLRESCSGVELPPNAIDVLAKLLHPDPEQRFQTPGEFLEEIPDEVQNARLDRFGPRVKIIQQVTVDQVDQSAFSVAEPASDVFSNDDARPKLRRPALLMGLCSLLFAVGLLWYVNSNWDEVLTRDRNLAPGHELQSLSDDYATLVKYVDTDSVPPFQIEAIRHDDGETLVFSSDQLPPKCELTVLRLGSIQKFATLSEQQINQLETFPMLRDLYLSVMNFENRQFQEVVECVMLQSLFVRTKSYDIGADRLKRLAELKLLRNFHLSIISKTAFTIDEPFLKSLLQPTTLVSVYLQGNLKFRAERLPTEASLRELRYCYLEGSTIPSTLLADICRMPKLKTLKLKGGLLSERSFEWLGEARGLQRLTLEDTQLSHEDTIRQSLTRLKNLRVLELENINGLTGSILSALAQHGTLERISLRDSQFKDLDLSVCRTLPALKVLELSNVSLDTGDLSELESLGALQQIILVGHDYTEQEIDRLKDHLTETKVVD